MAKRAQVWTLDFTISLLIFLSAVSAIIFAWNYILSNTLETRTMDEMQLKALAISDSAIRTSGIPHNWNETNVEVIGIATEENILNITKVNSFVNMLDTDYDNTRGRLDIGFYGFYFELKDLNESVLINSSHSIDPLSSIVIPIERYVLYNESVAKARFILWV